MGHIAPFASLMKNYRPAALSSDLVSQSSKMLPTKKNKKKSSYNIRNTYTLSTNKYRVASGPGISGNLEKSGNFVALTKCQGKVREFREI